MASARRSCASACSRPSGRTGTTSRARRSSIEPRARPRSTRPSRTTATSSATGAPSMRSRRARSPTRSGSASSTAFFFWSSWAASTNRVGDTVTYTSNWPHEPLVGNRPTGEAVVWTGVSIIMLLAGIGAMAFWHARAGARRARRASRVRSAARLDADAVAAGDREVLLGRLRARPGADRHGRHHRALRRRGQRVLRHSARPVPAVLGRRARGTCSSASSGSRPRGSPPASTSCPPSPASSRRDSGSASTSCSARSWSSSSARWSGQWLSVKQMLPGELLVLVRPQRLRVHRPGQGLADRAARRPVPVALPDGPRHHAGAPPRRTSSARS